MNMPILFADLNATKVLGIIHWIGMAFVFLWFLGSCMKDGMWNNGLRCISAFVASMLSFPLAVLAAGLFGGSSGASAPDDYLPLAIAIGANWIAFVVCLGVILTLTDGLSQVKVAFHPIVNSVGSFIFICGIAAVFLFYATPIYSVVQALK
ncbi:MAG TPA: hypothetical protein VNH11_20415 [Pirellulales bacterium]|nr:hypothetical protein [Pirellulales bacterium]